MLEIFEEGIKLAALINEIRKKQGMASVWGGSRKGSGRKPKIASEAGSTISGYLSQEDIFYLDKWGKGRSDQLRRLIERARLMWPKGE